MDEPQHSHRISVDDHLKILANPQRRRFLLYLSSCPEHRSSIAELVEHLRSRADDTDSTEERVRQRLRHVHFPKLADAGLVTYDIDSNVVRYDESRRMEALLDQIRTCGEAQDDSTD